MVASIFIPPQVQYIDANGEPMVGGKIYTYETDMSTPRATYTDYSATVPNTNPVILDSAGRAAIWISGAYGIRVTDANDVPVYSANNVISYTSFDFTGLTATVDDLNSTTTTGIYTTVDYTTLFTDRGKTVLVNASSAETRITLPPIADVPNEWKICIKKIDFSENNVVLVTNGTEKIDDVDDMRLYDYGDFVEILADGSEWRIVASQYRGAFVNITSDTTIDLSYNGKTIFCDTASNSIIITLPAIADVGNSFTITFKTGVVSGNHVIVNPSSPATIDGDASLLINEGYESFTLKANLVKNTWYTTDSHLSTINTTADTKFSYNPSQSGWAQYGTDGWEIGNASSSAHYKGNQFHDLYITLYNTLSDSICPVSGGRTGNAENDWNNVSKRLMLPKVGGRVYGAAGSGSGITTRTNGQNTGAETHLLAINEIPQHDHLTDITIGPAHNRYGSSYSFAYAGGGGGGWGDSGDINQADHTSISGGTSTFNVMQPTHFLLAFIKL